ncbi:hypothetical protein BDR03DRAFT_986755 [Suillus americanus]|nr:hypothetical protein BDR03DRAFT_986755 [Suillus americanus]
MSVPTCPNCGKIFAKDSSVTRHLSQPQTSCHSSIRDIVNISQFAEVELPSCHTSPQADAGVPTTDMHNLDDPAHANFDGDFNFSEDGFGAVEGSLEERKENLFYPFASKEEWEIGDFLLCSPLSMATIDVFLKLPLVQKLRLSFSNTREFAKPLHLIWVYLEWMTGDAAWEMQTQFPQGATVLGTILSSDKTNITTMTAFLLTALLPIPKYIYPHQRMRGLLEDCLMHECLSIVLKPLMKAAEIGIMMSDLVGSVWHCFTPLAAYITDMPEAAMLACLTSITVDPAHLEAYFDACAEYRLNGIYAPFWMDWPLADPSIFLMSEALHHWHKEFFDHDCQWCLVAVGASELDFQFSILQPVTGYRHFTSGISKLKQVTGRALLAFHENKDIIMTLGARMGAKKPIDNWFTPKLEFLQSITSGTRNMGALIQWSADATEHVHVSEIKDPACHTNNNDYDPQICQHLDRDEKLRCFAIATTLKNHSNYRDLNPRPGDIPKEEEEEEEAINYQMNHTCITTNYFSKARKVFAARDEAIPHPPQIFIAGGTAINLNYNPSHTGVSVDDVTTDFNIPDLHVETAFHDSSITLPAQTIHASPPGPGWSKGRQDTVLVNVEGGSVWPESGLTGHAICELHLIMHPIPRRGSRATWRDQYLCYVQVLTTGSVDPATDMIILKCAKYTDGTPIGNIVPLRQLHSFISLIPQLGDVADARFTKATSMHYSQTFLLNNYLLATVTTSIPTSGNFQHWKQEDMDPLMKHELLLGPDDDLMGGERVLWDQGIQNRTSSILDILIPKSSLKIEDLRDIRYAKMKDGFILHGSSVMLKPRGITRPQWRLTNPFSRLLKRMKMNPKELQTDTEVEEEGDEDLSVGEDMMEMDGSWSQKSYQTGEKCPIMAVKVAEEKNWECLFRSIYYDMRNKVKAKMDSLPFHVLLEPQYWSSEFSAMPVPDPNDSRKPDLVLLDYRLKERSGKEKPCHSALGFNPTIHIFNTLCSSTAHDPDDLLEGVGAMPIGAIGWVTDDDKNKWKYVLKDCWVDADIIEQEVNFLRAVNGVPNVVQLVKYWDVEYGGHIDSTSKICDHVRDHLPASPIFTNKIHCRMLLTPCGLPLTTFKSVPELVNVFLDLVVAHKTMMTQRGVLHGDLSPNNLIIYKGKGFFIDFDHTKFIKLNNRATDSCGTGTIPYISWRLLKVMGRAPTPHSVHHRASDDLKSLFYILLEFTTIYNGPGGLTTKKGVPPENAHRWHKAYVTMDKDGLRTSGTLKREFLMEKALGFEPALYFRACRPILEDWRMAMGDAIMNALCPDCHLTDAKTSVTVWFSSSKNDALRSFKDVMHPLLEDDVTWSFFDPCFQNIHYGLCFWTSLYKFQAVDAITKPIF